MSSVVTAMLVVGCAGRAPMGQVATGGVKDGEAVVVHCETAEQIRALRPCKATVEKHHPCYSVFRTEEGRRLTIGSPGASQEVIQFLRTLRRGETYVLPDAFLDYQRSHKQCDV